LIEEKCKYLLTLYYFTHFVGFVEVLQLRGRRDDGSSWPGVGVAVGGDVVGDGGGGVAAVLHLAPVSRLPPLEPRLESGEVCFSKEKIRAFN
jgi:hypothetical protein